MNYVKMPSQEVAEMVDVFVEQWVKEKDINYLEPLLRSIMNKYPQFLKKFLHTERKPIDLSLFGNTLGSEFVNVQAFDDETLRLSFKKDDKVFNFDITAKGISVSGLEIDSVEEVENKEKLRNNILRFPK